MIKFVVIFSAAVLVVASAVPILVEDEQGLQYYLEPVESTPVLSRHRRQEPKLPGPNDPKLFGEYNANSHMQSGGFNYVKPDGSGFSLGHQHINGFGHTVSADGRFPVWSNGPATVNLGVGATQHFGGWPGNQNLDKRVGLGFNYRF